MTSANPKITIWSNAAHSTYREEALQIVRVRLNRFLTNLSLPSLLPTRPLDLSNPYLAVRSNIWFYYPSFFPEPIPYACGHFPQFDPRNCGRFLNNRTYPGEIIVTSWNAYDYYAWLVAVVSTAIGVVFSLRSIILLQFSNATFCLPYTRYFLISAIIISTLAALESCIIYQKFYDIEDGVRHVPQILSEFDSPNIVHSLPQFSMMFLVSSKHISLVLLIFCYLDLILFYRYGAQKRINILSRTKRIRISFPFFIFATVSSAILFIYLHSQLFIAVRGRKPNYSREPRHMVYMPFIMVSKVDLFYFPHF